MPIRPEDIRGLTPRQIAQRYSPEEIRSALQTAAPAPVSAGSDGITPYNPNEDFFSSQNMGAMAGNLLPSAANMAGDVFNAVTSPVETAKSLYDMGISGFLKGLGERYGSLDAIKKTAVEDPFGTALDVAPGVQALGRGASVLGKGGRMASMASKANPIGVTARAAGRVGDAVGTAGRSIASAASGIDPGVLSTGREVLGATAREMAGKVDDPARFVRTQRREFVRASRGAGAQDIQQAIKQVGEGMNQQLDQIAKQGEARFGSVPIDPAGYDKILEGLDPRLSQRGVDIAVGDEGISLDFSRSVIPRKKKAQARISEAVDYAFEPLAKDSPTIGDAWLARRRIDEMRGSAARKGRNAEAGMIRQVRQNVDEYLASIDNPDFQRFNSEYAAGAAMREHFETLISGKIDPDNQVASLIRSIKSGRGLSERFLVSVEAQTGVPLRAIAAGSELSDILPRGLIGRSMIASAPFAGTVLGPEVLAGLLLTPPKFIGFYLRAIGATERAVKGVGSMIESVMSVPQAAALAEQGLTLGAIINQLDRERPKPVSTLGAMGRASYR